MFHCMPEDSGSKKGGEVRDSSPHVKVGHSGTLDQNDPNERPVETGAFS